MRTIVGISILLLAAQPILAQKSPKESARVWLGVHEQIAAASQYSMRIQSSVSTEADPYYVWQQNYQGLNTPVQSPNAFFQIYPGRLYTFSTASNSWNSADVQFDVPPGYTLYMGPLNVPMTPRTSFSTQNYGGGGGNWQMSFYVVPSDGAAWLSPGYSRPPHVSDVTWAISLGTLSCGASTGTLRWQSSSVSQALLDSTALNFATAAPVLNAVSSSFIAGGPASGTTPTYYSTVSIPDQIATYYDNNGYLKYIGTNQVQIYISRGAGGSSGYSANGQYGGYTIQVYSAGVHFEWANNDPTQAWTFASGYTDQYTISDPNYPSDSGSWSGSVQISRIDSASGQTDNWTLASSGNTTTITQTNALRVITLVSTPISGGRTETYTVADNNNNVALQKLRTYQTFPWGEELVSEVADPNGLALTTSYTYYNTTWGDGHYSKLQSVTNPDGSWVLYNYFDDFAHWGELASVSSPWQDSPTSYTAATQSNCKVTTYNYASQVYFNYYNGVQSPAATSVYQTVSAGTQTSINGVMTAQTTIAPTFWLQGSWGYLSSFYGNEPMRTDTIQSYAASGTAQTTVKTVFHNTSDPIYNGKLYSQVNPDGTKVSASYWKGDFYSYLGSPNWNSSSATPDSNSATWISNYLSGTSTQQDPTAQLYTTDGINSNVAIDPVWMTPYKSYRRQTITDSYGNPWFDVNEVFTGSGFEIISWRETDYTWDGILVNDRNSTGSWTKYSCIDGFVNYQTNPDGTRTQYFFDGLMRVTQSEFKSVAGSGSFPAMGAVETYFTYDGAGNVLTTSKQSSGGGLTLATSSSYSKAGLLLSQTDSTGLTTSYSYSNGGSTVTTTYPNGSTKVTSKHLDGSVKSVTGNAQVDQYTSSAVNGDGTITTTTYLATSGSPRWSATQTDWLGRTISQSQPAFGGGTFVKQSVYNTLGQLAKTTQTGMSATLYQYDGLGQLQYTGLDVNNNGQLDLGGTDRITETRSQVYEDANSIWWNRTQTYVFNVQNNSTPVLKSDVRQKLVPYPSTTSDYNNGVKITETDTYDFFGNLTTEIVNSGFGTAIVTDTTTLPNSTVPKVVINYNGVKVSSQSPQNLITTYQYDGLYRETSEVDPRKGTSYTAYFTSGTGANGQVSSRTDAAGNATTYTYDSTDGRLFSQSDPLGNTVYHAYDHVGREIKTWGTGTFPVEYAFDAYGAQIAMRTFRTSSINFGTSSWPLSDDGSDPQNPSPGSWSNGDMTQWAFDGPSGLLSSKTDASGQSVSYTYNPNGKLATRTWARGVVTSYTYDPNTAEQIGIGYSDGTPSLTYTYDRLGHGSSVVQTYSGFTLSTGLQYNVPGKLTQETFDPTYFSGRQLVVQLDTTNTGTLGRTIGYELGTSSSPGQDQAASFGYDSVARLNSEGLAGGPTFSYAFTANSNLIGSITDSADNWSQARTWDSHRDLLDTIQTSAGGTTAGSFTYAYDNLGRRVSKLETGALFARYPAGGLVDAYSYDTKSEVTGDQAYQSTNPTSPTNPVLGRGFAFAYDPIGNRTTSSVDTQQTSYSTNALNQITSRVVPGYYPASGFAPIGATVTLNGTAIPSGQFSGQYYLENVSANNSGGPLWLTAQLSSSLGGSATANAFLPQSPESSTYDTDGNLLTDGRWNYFWDAENRLKAIETYGNQPGNSNGVWTSGVPLIHIDFKYDYKGRRISKALSTWNGSAFAASSEIRYAYENWNLIADYSVSGSTFSLAHGYLWGIDLSGKRQGAGGVGGLLAMVIPSSTFEFPVFDANGNVHGLTDRATGQVTAAYEYGPFGQLLRVYGAYAQSNPIRFSSKYTDNETDLVYYGHRYYNPALGRFLGRDPIHEKGGLHLYAFAANNTVNRWDYLGMGPSSSNLTAAYLASLGIDPNGNIDPALAAQNEAEQAQMSAKYGLYNSGGPLSFGGSGGIMSGFFNPVSGSDDPTLYNVNTGNGITQDLEQLPNAGNPPPLPKPSYGIFDSPTGTVTIGNYISPATGQTIQTSASSISGDAGVYGAPTNAPLSASQATVLQDPNPYMTQKTTDGCGPAAAWNLIAAGSPNFLPANAYSQYQQDEINADNNGGQSLEDIQNEANSYSTGTGLSAQLTLANSDSDLVAAQALLSGAPFVATTNTINGGSHAQLYFPNANGGATVVSTAYMGSQSVVITWTESYQQVSNDIANSQGKGNYQVVILVGGPG